MEKVKYEELSESNSGKVKEVETINKTLHNLNSLFKTSGCDDQICEIISGKLPESVKGNALVSLNPQNSSLIFWEGWGGDAKGLMQDFFPEEYIPGKNSKSYQ